MQIDRNVTQLLGSCDIGFDARILEDGRYRWLESTDGAIQTIVELNDRNRVILPVVQSLLVALALHVAPRDVLNLGMGGGALERALQAARPDILLTSVEKSARMVSVAHEYFFLPLEQNVVVATAEDYLRRGANRFDIIWCDIFNGDRQPDCLNEASFYAAVQERLTPAGVFAANLRFTDNAALVELLLPLRASLPWVAVHQSEGYDNVAVFAARQPPQPWQGLAVELDLLGKEFAIDFTPLSVALAELPSRA